tara:strand:- start:241 stop:456 length:216 start_codon:yes stop_codon:yes gene_type:complete
MNIRQIVERLEEIESSARGKTRELTGHLIDDLIEFDLSVDMKMQKEFKKMESGFLELLLKEGIKSGSIGES